MTVLGIDNLTDDILTSLKDLRCGLLCNQASVNREFVHSRFVLSEIPSFRLKCIFSPQHGFAAEKQDNMIESDHGVDRETGLTIYSLYGQHRRPTAEMFDDIDVLFIDLNDVGTRVYTFIYTMAYCLEAATESGKKVIVLDRPNPIGGLAVEGNLLKKEFTSFVGLYPLPMRHGMTIGELALLFNDGFNIGADLEVVRMAGWRRSMYFEQTGLPWVFPSPNMPTPTTALVYPGQVIWEGTNVSEGRGTTLPFELVGAPYWEIERIQHLLSKDVLDGCLLRPVLFEPTSGKWAGRSCCGFQVHVLDRHVFKPYRTSLALYQTVFSLYNEEFGYKEPPYEYEFEMLPMDLILGNRSLRKQIEAGVPITELEQQWQPELEQFIEKRKPYLLYEE
ncbi:MAG: DUF1343 domain-containing protein [Desulfofustis sp.]|nr:DUF1343 domain-containing protein [Desulfofustis sp.]